MQSFARGWVVLGVIAWGGCEVREQRSDAGRESGKSGVGGAAASGGGQSGTAGTDSASISGKADAGSVEPASAVPTRFVIENIGAAPALLGASDCYGRWLSLAQGNKKQRWDESCLCQCGSGMACVCPGTCPRVQELLMPSLTTELEWDGVLRDVQASECFEPRVPAHGSALTATACWDGPINSGVAPTCSSTDFKYGQDELVKLAATAEATQPHQLRLTLKNGTGVPIEIITEHCGEQGWFKLDMGEHSSATAFCPCACSADKQQASCPTCGGCADDMIATIAPDKDATLEWDGSFRYTYPSRCTERFIYPVGMYISGKLCWRKTGETTERCTALALIPGDLDSITVTAQ